MELLENFRTIEVETPVDKIVSQIKGLIASGQLKIGDRLPSERKLSEKLGVGRTYIRDAIKKLEFLGILTTMPQSGVYVKGVDISILEGLLSNVMKIEKPDFFSLVETRLMIERYVVQLAAQRRTEEHLEQIEAALEAYREKVNQGKSAEQEDLNFHLTIVDASQNKVAKTLMLIILPDILKIYIRENVCPVGEVNKSLLEHEKILDAIKKQDVALAEKNMLLHLRDVYEFSKSKVNFL